MLVTDGSFSGTKDARARELGTRRVTPEQYAVLLRHVQPAVEKAMQVARRLYAATPHRHHPHPSLTRQNGASGDLRTRGHTTPRTQTTRST